MDSTMDLDIGFKGGLKLDGMAVPLAEGYLKLGGIVGDSDGLPFGVVVSANPTDPSVVKKGKASGNVVRGISVFDDAIAQNAPAHASRYLEAMPCAFVAKGLVKIENVDLSDVQLGYKVEFNTTTGVLGFVESTASTGAELLSNAEVVEITNDAVYVWLS